VTKGGSAVLEQGSICMCSTLAMPEGQCRPHPAMADLLPKGRPSIALRCLLVAGLDKAIGHSKKNKCTRASSAPRFLSCTQMSMIKTPKGSIL